MKKQFLVFVALLALPGFANADQLCGSLYGYCGNGWCQKSISENGNPPVDITPENDQVLDRLNSLIAEQEGTRVCVQGALDSRGIFHVDSVNSQSITTMESRRASNTPSHYVLECDDNNIFEGPLVIYVREETAMAEGSFSGADDAIFSIHYSHLAAIPQSDGGLLIQQPHTPEQHPHFSLSLRPSNGNRFEGALHTISTDSDKIPYSGEVSCVRK